MIINMDLLIQIGQEKIPCEYDRVTWFNEIEVDNNLYYVALAKKDSKFYMISKNNDRVEITDNLEKHLQNIDNYFGEKMPQMFNTGEDYRSCYVESFEFFLGAFTRGEKDLNRQMVEQEEVSKLNLLEFDEKTIGQGSSNKFNLSDENPIYYYSNENYSIMIEQIVDEQTDYNEKENNYMSYYESEDEEDTKYNVTIIKNNGDTESSIVYLPYLDCKNATLATFSNGFIEFEDEDRKYKGWYDNNGNKTTIPNAYMIIDIKDNKVFLREQDNEDENYDMDEKIEYSYIIIDLTGKTLFQTGALDIYDNMYLVKNSNNKMVLIDEDLKEISKQYDKIITNMHADVSSNLSSYY